MSKLAHLDTIRQAQYVVATVRSVAGSAAVWSRWIVARRRRHVGARSRIVYARQFAYRAEVLSKFNKFIEFTVLCLLAAAGAGSKGCLDAGGVPGRLYCAHPVPVRWVGDAGRCRRHARDRLRWGEDQCYNPRASTTLFERPGMAIPHRGRKRLPTPRVIFARRWLQLPL